MKTKSNKKGEQETRSSHGSALQVRVARGDEEVYRFLFCIGGCVCGACVSGASRSCPSAASDEWGAEDGWECGCTSMSLISTGFKLMLLLCFVIGIGDMEEVKEVAEETGAGVVVGGQKRAESEVDIDVVVDVGIEFVAVE
ncbi:hypothetical protein B0H13DRAFT_1931650 [Mycena leptocephala]|nr:hypothetical protein B0H13DRAFT_1931650 [Mycena leptocephala]